MASNGISYWGNQSMLRSASDAEVVFRNLFLSIPMFIGFILNSLILVIVARHHSIRYISVNKFIMNLVLACLADTLLNMPFILSTSIYEDWPTTPGFCVANMFFCYLTDSEILFALLLLSLDRYILAREPRKYETQLHYSRSIAVMCLFWFCGVLVGIPMFITSGSVPSPAVLFVPFFACTYGPSANSVYVIVLMLSNFVIPFVATVVLYILVLRIDRSQSAYERERDRRPNTASSMVTITTIPSSSESSNQLGSNMSLIGSTNGPSRRQLKAGVLTPDAWLELYGYKLTACITICWCITALPYSIYLSVQRLDASFSQSASLLYTHYTVNTVFFWLRAQFVLITPIIILCAHPGIREKAYGLLCCAACQLRNASKVSSHGSIAKPNVPQSISSVSLRIPIIYATNDGLHMKTYQNSTGPQNGDHASPTGSVATDRRLREQPRSERIRNPRKRKMLLNLDVGGSVSRGSVSSTRAIIHASGDYGSAHVSPGSITPSGTLPPSVPCDVPVAAPHDDTEYDEPALHQDSSDVHSDSNDNDPELVDNDNGNALHHDALASDAEPEARAPRANAFELHAHVYESPPAADEQHNLAYYEYYVEQTETQERPRRHKKRETNADLDSSTGRHHHDEDPSGSRKHRRHRKHSASRNDPAPETDDVDIVHDATPRPDDDDARPAEKKSHRRGERRRKSSRHAHAHAEEATVAENDLHVAIDASQGSPALHRANSQRATEITVQSAERMPPVHDQLALDHSLSVTPTQDQHVSDLSLAPVHSRKCSGDEIAPVGDVEGSVQRMAQSATVDVHTADNNGNGPPSDNPVTGDVGLVVRTERKSRSKHRPRKSSSTPFIQEANIEVNS